ncbi:MAG: polymer-forming cytoskeletal protein [Bacteroidales bacterium]|nr:polymer-forming cytoskeletal protein [Bacteroidales bacterium]
MQNNANINEVTRIAAGAFFKGELSTDTDIRLDGRFEGKLETKGRLVVGVEGVVDGDIICNDVDFGGKMNSGTFLVKETLSLKSGCQVNGDLRFKRLQIELDAKFTGRCKAIE